MRVRLCAARWLAGLLGAALSLSAAGQQTNPVYPDDSAVARDGLGRAAENLASGNDAEAVRELQRLLDEQPERVVGVAGDEDLFVSVRARVHEQLLASPALLERYRLAESVRAQQQLDGGDAAAVERSRLLTAAGFEAALRVAQMQLEAAAFEGARLTLEQLEHHPERRGPGGRDAAGLAALVARYVNRGEVWEWARRWGREAGVPGELALTPAARPPALGVRRADFFSSAPRVSAAELPDRPLWSMPITPERIPLNPEDLAADFDGSTVFLGWVLPTVLEDTVYVNDGTFVTARDRFTLQPRWTVRPVGPMVGDDPFAARRLSRSMVEDTASISALGRTLVCTMGASGAGERQGDPGTYALDAATGAVIWGVSLPMLDSQLEGAVVRGPALIEGDTVVLVARKVPQSRRMVSLYLVGLGLGDGSLRWVRPIASAGSLMWNQRSDTRNSGAMLHEGVVYCTDNLGVIAAVEASSGRPVWVRRAQGPSFMTTGGAELVRPWQFSAPIAHKGSVLALSPDKQGLVQIETGSGRVLARRSASALGGPFYLLKVGERFAAVGADVIVLGPLDNVGEGTLRRSRVFAPGLFGRVLVSGEGTAARLLAPIYEGAAVVDPAQPDADPVTIRLERIGNLLPLENQLLAIDSESIHSYLTWSVANELLDRRMRENPTDPEPAITYCELAYRAQHHGLIAGAADRALEAIEKGAAAEGSRLARQRLFAVLRDMVEYSQERWSGGAEAPAPRAAPEVPRRARRGAISAAAVAASRPEAPRPVLDLAQMGPVLDRMGRAAQTADEQVSHLIALGRLREAEMRGALAAEAYQRVLAEPALAAANWRVPQASASGAGGSIRADLEATRRIRQLVIERGPEAYAAFEAQAARELAGLGAGSAEALERLARQYPASSIAAGAWLRAADLLEQSSQPRSAVAALREALIAAETAVASGLLKDPAVLPEAAGRLITALSGIDQEFAASQVLARLRMQHPGLTLADRGKALDPEGLGRELAARLARQERFPRVGARLSGAVQALPGWSLMTPQNRDQPGRPAEHLVMVSRSENRVGVWGFSGGSGPEGPAGAGAQLQAIWSRTYSGQPPVLLRTEPGAVYLWWERTEANQGPVIEKIGAVGGETLWRSDPLRSLFPEDPGLEQRRQVLRNTVSTPIDGAVRMSDVVVAVGERVMVMAERSGRAAAFDRESGRVLWAQSVAVGQVNDIAAGAGLVVIGGTPPPEAGLPAGNEQLGVAVTLDAISGKVLRQFGDGRDQLRWVRMAPGQEQAATAIIGYASQVVSFDPSTGRANWAVTGAPAFLSLDAWVFGDRLFLLDQQRDMWQVETARGALPDAPLAAQGRLSGQDSIQGALMPGGRSVCFATDRGVVLFDPAGRLAGADAFNGAESDRSFLPAGISEGSLVLVESTPREAMNERVVYNLHILDTASAMLRSTRALQLEAQPRRLALIDGHIAITAGNVTLVYEAPEGDRP
jgi:outer membrane protein assembly factor BamB